MTYICPDCGNTVDELPIVTEYESYQTDLCSGHYKIGTFCNDECECGGFYEEADYCECGNPKVKGEIICRECQTDVLNDYKSFKESLTPSQCEWLEDAQYDKFLQGDVL